MSKIKQTLILGQPIPRFLINWLISAVALIVVVHIFSGVSSDNLLTTIVMALILGLINTFLRPILCLLSLPFIVFTLGAFTLIINALTFYLAASLVHGFYVASFWSAFWAALLYSFISFLINILIQSDDKKIFYMRCSCRKCKKIN